MWIPWRAKRIQAILRGNRTALRAGLGGLCVVMTAAGLACADDSEDTQPAGREASPKAVTSGNVVTDKDIRAAPANSVDRSLLTLFQAVQFQDFEAARDLISLGERRSVGRARLRRMLGLVGPALGKPDVLKVRREGDHVVARVLIMGFEPGKARATSSSPTTFTLVRQGGEWLVSDISYLVRSADEIAASKRAAARGTP